MPSRRGPPSIAPTTSNTITSKGGLAEAAGPAVAYGTRQPMARSRKAARRTALLVDDLVAASSTPGLDDGEGEEAVCWCEDLALLNSLFGFAELRAELRASQLQDVAAAARLAGLFGSFVEKLQQVRKSAPRIGWKGASPLCPPPHPTLHPTTPTRFPTCNQAAPDACRGSACNNPHHWRVTLPRMCLP